MTEGLGFGRRRLISKVILENWKLKRPEDKKFTFNELLFVIQEMLEEEGKEYLQGRGTALRGHHIFRMFVKHLLYRNLANYDSMVLITAEKGVGKSSAAIMLAREWCRLIGIRFNPSRHIAYSGADVMNKIDALNKFEPLIADEAVRFASSADWNKKGSKELKKKLAQVRTKHLFYILAFPLKVYKLEKTYLESFVNYWCLSGDTKILIKDKSGNRNINMKDLVQHKNYKVATYNNKTKKIEYKKPKGCILTKKNVEVYEIELENGQKIKATKDHLFLTDNGYKKLAELKAGDSIVCE